MKCARRAAAGAADPGRDDRQPRRGSPVHPVLYRQPGHHPASGQARIGGYRNPRPRPDGPRPILGRASPWRPGQDLVREHVDLEAGTISVRRSVRAHEDTKTNRSRRTLKLAW